MSNLILMFLKVVCNNLLRLQLNPFSFPLHPSQIDYLDMEKGTFTSKSKRLTEMAIPHAYGAVVVYQNFLFVLGGDSDRCTNDRHAVKHVYR